MPSETKLLSLQTIKVQKIAFQDSFSATERFITVHRPHTMPLTFPLVLSWSPIFVLNYIYLYTLKGCLSVKVKKQFAEVRSHLSPSSAWGLNSGCKTKQPAPSPTELSYLPKALIAPGFHSFFCRKPESGILLILHHSSPAPFRCIWMLHAQDIHFLPS